MHGTASVLVRDHYSPETHSCPQHLRLAYVLCRGGEMATAYLHSALAQRNAAQIAIHTQQHSVLSRQSLKELKTKRATVNHVVS